MPLIKRYTPGGNLHPDGASTFAVLREIFEETAKNRDTVDAQNLASAAATAQTKADAARDSATSAAAQDATTKANGAESRAKAYADAGDATTLSTAKSYTDVSFAASGPGGATDEQIDAAVDRAVLDGRLANEVSDTAVATQVTGGTSTRAALDARTGAVLAPSGDSTGATDVAAINAVLVNRDLTVRGGTFYTNAPIRIPSNRTLTIQDATVHLVPGSNCNVVQNFNQNTTGDDNVSLVGVGRAHIIGGNASTQPTTNAYQSIGVTFTNVRGLRVNGLKIGPTKGPAMVVQGITGGVVESIDIAQDRTNTNQDGIDVGPSTDGLTIRGITGVTEDDGFAIFATPTAGFAHNMYKGDTNTYVKGIKNVSISDVDLDVGIHPVRLQAASPLGIENVRISNYRNRSTLETSPYAVMIFGPVTTYTPAPKESFKNITLSGYQGPGNVIVGSQTHFSYVTVSDVTLTGPWKTFMGTENASTNYNADVAYVSFDNVTTTDNSSGATLLNTPIGTYEGVSITNTRIRRLANVLNNYGTLNNLYLSDITIGALTGQIMRSNVAETGQANNVFVHWTSSTTLYAITALKLRLGANMPAFGPNDLTPTAATKGSTITCKAGKDPTGGSFANGGQYIANGSAWVRTVDLGANY